VELKSAQVNAQLEDFVHTVRGASSVFAHEWVAQYPSEFAGPQSLGAASAHLRGFVADRPHFSGAYITDSAGNILAPDSSTTDQIGDPAFFKRIHTSGSFTVSDVIAPENEGSPFALFAQPLILTDGSHQYLVLKSDLLTISGIMDMRVGFPHSAKSGVFDSKGTILAGTGYEAPHPGMAAGRDITASAVWQQASSRPTGVWFGPGLDQIERIVVFGYPDGTPWITTVAFAQSDLFGPLWSRIRTFGTAGVATVLVVFWAAELVILKERRSLDVLERQRVVLNASINGSRDGMIVIGGDGVVTYANSRFVQLFSEGSFNPVGRTSSDLLDLISLRQIKEGAIEDLSATIHGSGVETVSMSFGGVEPLDIEVVGYPLSTEAGEEVGRSVVLHDVSKAKTLDRMKSQLLATASHQLRTPMTSILAYSDLLLEQDPSPEERREWLQTVYSESVHMTSIINSMLNVSEIESGQVTMKTISFDAGMEAESIATKFSAKYPTRDIRVDIAPAARLVRGDKDKFGEIVENLVDNAFKYSGASTKIRITATEPAEQMVSFAVSDDGIGIPEYRLNDLFMPFSRLRDDSNLGISGSGLGLYIAKSLVERQGGTMWVESKRGEGTTIRFTLPAAQLESSRADDFNRLAQLEPAI